MTTTLIDYLRSKFTPSAVQDLARILGENTTSTQKAVDGLVPAVTAGVVNRASTDEGATTLYNLLKTTPFDSDPTMEELIETSSHRQRAAESGNELLTRLYSDRPDRLAEATAQYSGIGMGSAATLSGLVMSILMGYLHKQVTTRSLTQPQLVALLRGEGDTARQAIPAALAGLLGWFIGTGHPVTTTTTTVPTETVTQVRSNDDRAGTPWWRWLLLGLLLLALLFWLLRSCNRDKDETTGEAATGSGAVVGADTVASDTVGSTGGAAATSDSAAGGDPANGPEVRVGVDLPGGRRLNVAENSFNYSLAQYLADKSRKPNKIFTFDNLTFETNSARITNESETHVNDLIQIMQAYPSLEVRIEGHTDNTGNEATNKILSDDRAESVKAALVKAGIDAGRITTKGFSEDKPVATNSTSTGRQENRRIDVAVTRL